MAPPVHIALVDDDDSVRRALSRLLSALGFEVSTFASAEEFLTSGNPDRATCMLLDVHLPRLSGLELRSLLSIGNRSVPVVFITGDDEMARSDEMRRTGARCLMKPLERDKLVAAIHDAVGVVQ
jgi:FixJ family two-component response regulator